MFKICHFRTAQDLKGEKGRKEKIFQNTNSGQFVFLKVVAVKVSKIKPEKLFRKKYHLFQGFWDRAYTGSNSTIVTQEKDVKSVQS